MCFRCEKIGLRSLELYGTQIGSDPSEDASGLDEISLLEAHLFNRTAELRRDLNLDPGLQPSGENEAFGEIGRPQLDDRHIQSRKLGGRFLGGAIGRLAGAAPGADE